MKIMALLWIILLTGLSLYACSSKATPAQKPAFQEAKAPEISMSVKEPWRAEWEKALEEGKREGKVVVYSTTGGETRDALVAKFKERTGITAEFVVGQGAEITNKVFVERRAGLYLADVYIGGATTIFNSIKPAGVLEPLKPSLILPDVKDLNMWWQKKLPFTDMEGKFVISFMAAVSKGGNVINTNLVEAKNLVSYNDLLHPRWKGKIVLHDPTVSGKGLRWFGVAITLGLLDLDYMKALAKQEPVVTRDRRQQVEWVALGKYPLVIAAVDATVMEFVRAGAPLEMIIFKEDRPWISAGGSNLVLFNGAPHPNASRIFINWLLGQEGQTIFARYYDSQSARVDVPADHVREEERRKPETNYFNGESEEFLLKQPEHAKVAKEIFGHLLK